MTFAELARDYQASSKFLALAHNTRVMYETHLERLVKLGGSLPIVDAPMQTPVALGRSRSPRSTLASEWFKRIDKLDTNVVKLATRTALSIVYKWAVMEGLVLPAQNPVPYIDKNRWKHEPENKRPFTPQEIDMVEQSANRGDYPPELRPYAYFVVVAWDLGPRPDEMVTHENTWFTKRDGDIYFDVYSAKGKALGEISRAIIMGPRASKLINWFRTQPIAFQCEKYTFRTNTGHRFHVNTISQKLKEVCRLAGVEPRRLYSTRHGLATAMLKAGQSRFAVAHRLGNSPETVRKHYAIQNLVEKAKEGQPLWEQKSTQTP